MTQPIDCVRLTWNDNFANCQLDNVRYTLNVEEHTEKKNWFSKRRNMLHSTIAHTVHSADSTHTILKNNSFAQGASISPFAFQFIARVYQMSDHPFFRGGAHAAAGAPEVVWNEFKQYKYNDMRNHSEFFMVNLMDEYKLLL